MVTDMETTLTDLLEQWSELEPERFTLMDDPVDVLADVYVEIGGDTWNLSSKDYGPDRYTIQGAIQEAVEARGWWWEIERSEDGHPLWYEADVNVLTDGRLENHGLAVSKESAAYALLSAYLKALNEHLRRAA